MEYDVYIDDMLLPITPAKIHRKINGKNKTISLINEGEVNILKLPGLRTVEFDMLIPQVEYSFAKYKNGFERPITYLNKLHELKNSKEPFQFKIIRVLPNGVPLFDTGTEEEKFTLEEYTIKEDVKQGFDVVVSVKLKEFKEYSTKLPNIITEDEKTTVSLENVRETRNSPEPKNKAESYVVVKGDTLWGIAKRFYGNGAKYTEIASKNNITNPNLLSVGQVLTLS